MLLVVPDEPDLLDLAVCLYNHDYDTVEFREPDLDWQLTAIAAGPEAGQALRRLPLALSEVERG